MVDIIDSILNKAKKNKKIFKVPVIIRYLKIKYNLVISRKSLLKRIKTLN